MKKRKIGSTNLEVTTLGFGGACLAGTQSPIGEQECDAIVDAALAAGIDYFDTAPFYGLGLGEQRMGRALRAQGEGVTISTKVGRILTSTYGGPASIDLFSNVLPMKTHLDYSYDGVMRSVEGSYNRMGVGRINILYIHDLNPRWLGDRTEEYFIQVMDSGYRALEELRRTRCVDAIGVGINDAEMLCRFARAGDFDLFMLSGRYNLLEQEALNELFPLCQKKAISVAIASPFASGILASGETAARNYFYQPPSQEVMRRVNTIRVLCDRYRIPIAAPALQFPLAHQAVTTVVAGVQSQHEMKQNIASLAINIPDDFWKELKACGLVREDAAVPSYGDS